MTEEEGGQWISLLEEDTPEWVRLLAAVVDQAKEVLDLLEQKDYKSAEIELGDLVYISGACLSQTPQGTLSGHAMTFFTLIELLEKNFQKKDKEMLLYNSEAIEAKIPWMEMILERNLA